MLQKSRKPTCIDLILTNFPKKSLIKEPTCYKNPEKPTCIDLILANSPTQFRSTLTLETDLLIQTFIRLQWLHLNQNFPIRN